MSTQELITQIVKEVLSQLNKIEIKKKKLTILGLGKPPNLTPYLSSNEKWDIRFQSLKEEFELAETDAVLFVEGSQDLIVKGALGIADTTETKTLATCLLEGIPVSIIVESNICSLVKSSSSASTKRYHQLLSKYVTELTQYGVSVYPSVEEYKVSFSEKQVDIDIFAGKLLTHREVQEWKGKIMKIRQSTIVTPLARDTAKELGKNICLIE
ncbi:hypothetical protein [Sutcliffiella cohnii]|uniref:hypothetical protein n=1 Tax=Sutcliffiella cohnii TaxID=33932 RepID=UPI002E219A24|nr:hypothetical protein [Sutcliffiella cohnii]